MDTTMHKPMSDPPLSPPPSPAAVVPPSHSSGCNSLLLTKAYCPFESDPDDIWYKRLLEEEESVETKRYLAIFFNFVAYGRYKTELKKIGYEKKQKLEARARAITRAKAEGQAKFQDKAYNKIIDAITEVLFSRL
ncbi:hypothetical protein BG015_011265 [Linnemannia schmuckeri]|uniref:Uncharacterized protein n=1 Tax=Linnemannia schmuckeri TaxID=64567 RepID=A0A9P5S4Z8_9FUNG|nr:hypothetical protein BG015_011265 [Linnemannia schmuckeri]